MRETGSVRRWLFSIRRRWRQHRFIRAQSPASLLALVALHRDFDEPLTGNEPGVREALFAMDSWSLADPTATAWVFDTVERWLVSDVAAAQPSEWAQWLGMNRRLARNINVSDERVALSLRSALRSGALDALSSDDRHFLIRLCLPLLQQSNHEVVGASVPALIEVAAASHAVGLDEASREELVRWQKLLHFRPRGHSDFRDEEILDAPLRGIGSPNGIVVTLYRDEFDRPCRLEYAGSTPDPTVNERVLIGLFASGLASDPERGLVLPLGGSVILPNPELTPNTVGGERLISAVLGPGGLVEPVAGRAHVGMAASEALDVAMELLRSTQAATGLVTVVNWHEETAATVEVKLRKLLASKGQGLQVLKHQSVSSAPASAVRALPLWHRDTRGQVVPAEIKVSLRALGLRELQTMLKTARRFQMRQLLENCKRREDLARNLHGTEKRQMETWRALPPETKDDICKRNPWVEIVWRVDFELGTRVRMLEPERRDRREYEETLRPAMVQHALQSAERFRAIHRKLEELDRDGGQADRLTSQMLVDSLLRKSTMPVADPQFQAAFQRWVDICATPVRAAVEDWCMLRGLDPEVLGRDNVIFGSSFDEKSDCLVIRPFVMIDLNAFELSINTDLGIFQSIPTLRGRLRDCLIPSPGVGISDLPTLHTTLCDWISQTFGNAGGSEEAQRGLEDLILQQPGISALIPLHRARHLIMNGQYGAALGQLEKIRKADLGPIYFWGAVAHQCIFLEHHHREEILGSIAPDRRAEVVIKHAIGTIVAWSRRAKDHVRSSSKPPRSKKMQGVFNLAGAGALQSVVVALDGSGVYRVVNAEPMVSVSSEAERYLGQLEARDPQFLKALVDGQVHGEINVGEVEKRSLGLSAEAQKSFLTAMGALEAMDLLALAELIRDQASQIPLSASYQSKVGDLVGPIMQKLENMPFGAPASEADIRALCLTISGGSLS